MHPIENPHAIRRLLPGYEAADGVGLEELLGAAEALKNHHVL